MIDCYDKHDDCHGNWEMIRLCNEAAFEASLRRAFVDGRASNIVIHSRRDRFLLEGAMFGELRGWLHGELHEYDHQSSALRYRLTDAGRVHFGLACDCPLGGPPSWNEACQFCKGYP